MKLTTSQLRQIIREELMSAPSLPESPADFLGDIESSLERQRSTIESELTALSPEKRAALIAALGDIVAAGGGDPGGDPDKVAELAFGMMAGLGEAAGDKGGGVLSARDRAVARLKAAEIPATVTAAFLAAPVAVMKGEPAAAAAMVGAALLIDLIVNVGEELVG